ISKHLLSWRRHRRLVSICHIWAFKTLIDGKAKHEWVAGGQAALHLGQIANDSLIEPHCMLGGGFIALRGRSLGKLCDIVRPQGLRAHRLCVDSFHPVAQLGATIGVYCFFNKALIVVDEQAGRDKSLRKLLLYLLKLNGASNGIGGTTT